MKRFLKRALGEVALRLLLLVWPILATLIWALAAPYQWQHGEWEWHKSEIISFHSRRSWEGWAVALFSRRLLIDDL